MNSLVNQGAPKRHVARRTIIVVLLSAATATMVLAVPGLQGVARQIEHLNAA